MKKINIKQFFVAKNAIKLSSASIFVIVLTIFLCVLGCVMVYSASSYSALKNYGNSFFFLTKQIVGVFVGALGLIFFYFFDYGKLKKLKWLLVAVAVIGLVFLLRILRVFAQQNLSKR